MLSRLLLALLLFTVAFFPASSAPAAGGCQFALGFKAIHDLIPELVGNCVADEHHNPVNGDGLQETTAWHGKGGLLAWRKLDNWTAFTDGANTWLNGPQGLQKRANTDRFCWEGDATSTSCLSGVVAISSATPPIVRSVDIAAFQAARGGRWFSLDMSALPSAALQPQASFQVGSALNNRRDGRISPTLLAGYFFIQWSISSSDFARYGHTIQALFLRSALLGFVDYPNNRVLGWDKKSTNIPTDIRGIVRLCNDRHIPVFLEANYSDYVPGPLGSGLESLQRTDNIANTISFLQTLEDSGLHVDGVTLGDEIEDEAGFGTYKPTIHNSDLVSKFIAYARAMKSRFPNLKIYVFDSYIGATRGQTSTYLDLLRQVRQAEIADNRVLIDGLTFRESYVYIDQNGNLLGSQRILDDTESLYRDTPVYRYDVSGDSHPHPDTAYLVKTVRRTNDTFQRTIDLGITEYLPAGPVQISETDTSRYSDMDFILHFSDVVGIYAELYPFSRGSWQAEAGELA